MSLDHAPRRRRTARRFHATPAAVTTAILVTGLLAAPARAEHGTGTPTGTVARTVGRAHFRPGPCPRTPEPVAALEKARCGTLTVPENRAEPDGRQIALGVAVVPAATGKPKPDPVVWLAGGPGDDAVGEAKTAIDGGLNRDRDVILMSQRGTYSADPALTCRNIDEFNAHAVGLVHDAPSTERLHLEATRTCRDRLAAPGIDLGAYNDTESAADYADLRVALGIDRWNVFGISYGTHLALVYMRQHPRGTRSVGIDGILPPSEAGSASTWSSARQGFDGLFKTCAEQPACNRRYPNLAATFERLVRDLEAHPVTTTVTVPGHPEPVKVVLDGGALVNWMTSATHVAAGVPRSLDELAHGKPRRIAEQWAGGRLSPQAFGRVAHGLAYGVFCGEWVPYESRAEAIRGGQDAFPSFPRSVLAQAPQLTFLRPDCEVWNVPAAPRSIREATRSDIPTLALSGGFDSQTGAAAGPYVARTLSRATVVTVPYEPHVVFATSRCAQEITVSFFDDPTAAKTGCLGGLEPPRFEIGP
ncbi:transporter [Streptomyces eurocidicus]|uniref:Pimeloyl-ACP methyl ester carboxylesterase n=1 Tax=Streptomyces eurocidicus TaxID=66423 RepID=A0A2N8NUC1_STREU|nr:alpha/beta hydrolase [Streptomyces eurocidicus]MBB5120211.1 pimeloyl-ACP methyl ester carboxylesterase [Streptomyces eurocidicus]MBF6056104.1 alpha/beta fold hydrolase [Streptomyces eurocidicus]PNE32365.1 transporter [Streptomyces eurocidicus]